MRRVKQIEAVSFNVSPGFFQVSPARPYKPVHWPVRRAVRREGSLREGDVA
jgi:hypothetical protein